MINNARYCIWVDRTQHPVDDHRSHGNLPVIRFCSRLTINQIGKKIPVALRKTHLGDISPAGLCRQFRHSDLLRELRLESRQIFLLLFQFLLIGKGGGLRLRNLACRSFQGSRGLADKPGHTALLRHYLHLIIGELFPALFLLLLGKLQLCLLLLHGCLSGLIFIQHLFLISRKLLDIFIFIQKIRQTPRRKEQLQIQITAALIGKLYLPFHGSILLVLQLDRLRKLLFHLSDLLLQILNLIFLFSNLLLQFIQVIAHLRKLRVQRGELSLQGIMLRIQSLQALLRLIELGFGFFLLLFRLFDLLSGLLRGLHRKRHRRAQQNKTQTEGQPSSHLYTNNSQSDPLSSDVSPRGKIPYQGKYPRY